MTARELQEENPPSGDEHALINSERRPPSLNLPSPISKGTPAPHPGSKGAGPLEIGATHPGARNGKYSGAPWELLCMTNALSKDRQEKSPTTDHWFIHEETRLLKDQDAQPQLRGKSILPLGDSYLICLIYYHMVLYILLYHFKASYIKKLHINL